MSLRWKAALLVLIVGVFAIGMVAFLNYAKFRSTFGHTVESRVVFVGETIRDGIESALALGLWIDQIPTVADLIAQEKASDALLLSIDVLGVDGVALYSSEADRKGIAAPPSWPRDAGSRSTWSLAEQNAGGDAAIAVGVPVRNTFGLQVGTVVLRYSQAYVGNHFSGFLKNLLGDAGLALAAMSIVVTGLLWLVIGKLKHGLAALEKPLDQMVSGAEIAPQDTHSGSLIAAMAQAESELTAIAQRLDETIPDPAPTPVQVQP